MSEPITTLTDYAIALQCLLLAALLWPRRSWATRLWSLAFVCTGLAAGLGGTLHGFAVHWSAPKIQVLWSGLIYSLGLASLCMLVGSGVGLLPRRWWHWFGLAALTKSGVYAAQAMHYNSFDYAVADYLSAMGVILALLIVARWSGGCTPATLGLAGGIGVSGLAAIAEGSGIRLGGLTHNDIFHLIQMVALVLFYQGARHLTDGGPTP